MHTPMQMKYATRVAHRRRASRVRSPLLDCTWASKGSMSAKADRCLRASGKDFSPARLKATSGKTDVELENSISPDDAELEIRRI